MTLEAQRQLDQIGGRLLTPAAWALLQASPRRPVDPPRRILIIKLWGLGSVALSLPLARALKDSHPGAHLTYLTLAGNAALLERVAEIDAVWTLDLRGAPPIPVALAQAAGRVAAGGFDLVLDLEFFSYATALLTAASRAPVRWGLRHPRRRLDWRDALYTDQRDASPPVHVAALWRSMAGIPTQAPLLFPSLAGVSPAALDGPLPVVVNPNASDLALERRWPAERFAALCDALVERFGARIHLVGLGSERGYTEGVRAAMTHRAAAVNTAGELSLSQLLDLIAGAALMITNDSGPLHLASALGVPTAAFFGPETPARYGPLAAQRRVFFRGLPCSPCMKAEDLKRIDCHNARRCMLELGAEEVTQAMVAFVDAHGLSRGR